MANVTVLNTDAGLSAKTLLNAEDAQPITGLKTFDRDPSAPYAVSAGSAVVANLDADKLDGQEGTYYTTGVGAMDTYVSNTEAGTLNNWAPAGLSGNTIIVWSGASDTTISGIAGGVNAQRLTIINRSGTSKILYFPHSSGSSATGNKLYNIITSVNTPVAYGGYITYQYDAANGVWWLVNHDQGAPIAFSPTVTDSGGTPATYSLQSGTYVLKGHVVIANGRVTCASKGSMTAGNTVGVAGLPIAAAAAPAAQAAVIGYFGGMTSTTTVITGFISPSGTKINLYRLDAGGTAMLGCLVSDINTTFDIIFASNYTVD